MNNWSQHIHSILLLFKKWKRWRPRWSSSTSTVASSSCTGGRAPGGGACWPRRRRPRSSSRRRRRSRAPTVAAWASRRAARRPPWSSRPSPATGPSVSSPTTAPPAATQPSESLYTTFQSNHAWKWFISSHDVCGIRRCLYAHTKTDFVYNILFRRVLFRTVYICINDGQHVRVFFWFFFIGRKSPPKKVDIFPCGFVKEIVKDLHMLIGSWLRALKLAEAARNFLEGSGRHLLLF